MNIRPNLAVGHRVSPLLFGGLVVTVYTVAWVLAGRLAQIQQDVDTGRRERVIAVGLEQAIPEETDVDLRRYLASQALAPPRPRARRSQNTRDFKCRCSGMSVVNSL